MGPGGNPRAVKAFLLLLLLAVGGSAAPVGDNPKAGRYVEIRGFRMYVEEYGSGPPVLMLHGNGGSMNAFAQNVPYFAAKYRVILADSRAQGKSLDPGHDLTFEMMADDFAALLDALHVPRAYVVGWSDGGIDALLLALRHPDKVIALAASGANLWPAADAFAPGVWAGMAEAYRRGVSQPRRTPREINDWKIFMLDYTQPHITPAQLHTLRRPCLILCGDHDMIAVPHTVLIFQSIPGANLCVIPDSGHATLMEHPEEFDRVVDEFLSRHPPGAPVTPR